MVAKSYRYTDSIIANIKKYKFMNLYSDSLSMRQKLAICSSTVANLWAIYHQLFEYCKSRNQTTQKMDVFIRRYLSFILFDICYLYVALRLTAVNMYAFFLNLNQIGFSHFVDRYKWTKLV